MKTFKEQITDLENTRAAKAARQTDIMSKAVTEGRSTDDTEADEFDLLGGELKKIDGDLMRLRSLEESNRAAATRVDGTDPEAASRSRAQVAPGTETRAAGGGGSFFAVPRTVEKLAPGIQFARFVMCVGAAKGDLTAASHMARVRFPHDEAINQTLKAMRDMGTTEFHKNVVTAADTQDGSYAGPLLAYNQFAGDFVEFLRPLSILGRFGTPGIPDLRRIPFNVHVRGQTSGGSGYWIGEGAPVPLTSFGFNDAYLGYTKLGSIAVLTEEMMRFSNPAAEVYVRDALASAIIQRSDTDFIDPANAGVANVKPASITNGVTPITSSGNTADDVRADIDALWQSAGAADVPPQSAVYITTNKAVRRLALMRNGLGQREFPDVTMFGGALDGVPIIMSNYVPYASPGSLFVLAFASEIWLADDNEVTIDASREASLQMMDNPTVNSATGTPTSLVSMFQTHSVALRAERYQNWKKRRALACAYIAGSDWGS